MTEKLIHVDHDAPDPTRATVGFGDLMRVMLDPSLAVSTLYATTKGSEECTA